AQRFHQVDAVGQARLSVPDQRELGVVLRAQRVQQLEVARVAGLVARTGQPRAVARRVEPHLQVALGRRAALAVGQRVADFPERTLDRLLVAAQRLAFTCLGLFGACLEASRVED